MIPATATVNPRNLDWGAARRRRGGVEADYRPMPFLFHADAVLAADRRARRTNIRHSVLKTGRMWLVVAHTPSALNRED